MVGDRPGSFRGLKSVDRYNVYKQLTEVARSAPLLDVWSSFPGRREGVESGPIVRCVLVTRPRPSPLRLPWRVLCPFGPLPRWYPSRPFSTSVLPVLLPQFPSFDPSSRPPTPSSRPQTPVPVHRPQFPSHRPPVPVRQPPPSHRPVDSSSRPVAPVPVPQPSFRPQTPVSVPSTPVPIPQTPVRVHRPQLSHRPKFLSPGSNLSFRLRRPPSTVPKHDRYLFVGSRVSFPLDGDKEKISGETDDIPHTYPYPFVLVNSSTPTEGPSTYPDRVRQSLSLSLSHLLLGVFCQTSPWNST